MRWGFLNPRPSVRPAGPHLIELLEPLEYKTDEYRMGVPRGFVCDGASVPRMGWAMLRSHWIDLLAFGVLHDYLYRKDAGVLMGANLNPVPSRRWADTEACRALKLLGSEQAADAWRVRLALLVGGRGAWHKRAVL